jgi:uncharacterized CHY-type Zn-finger protein
MKRTIHGVNVIGVDVDGETRCAHYHDDNDIIAIKFNCCRRWFPCHECHAKLAGHAPVVWPRESFDESAILCGGCGQQLTVSEYLNCNSVCPRCQRLFNPGCASHHHLYFEPSPK